MSTATTTLPSIESSPSEVDWDQGPCSRRGEPTWEIARFYPRQGEWTEEQYFALETNLLIELNDGVLEFLPMPSQTHQRIAKFLLKLLDEFVERHRAGEVYMMGYPVRLRSGKLREPDVVFVGRTRAAEQQCAEGADLVIEVVSEGIENRKRDLETKPAEYAAAGIPEYWTIDPDTKTVMVRTLDGEKYKVYGEFKPGQTATSVLLDGFTVDVAACFAAAEAGREPQTSEDG